MYLADYNVDGSDAHLAADAFCDFYDVNPGADCAIAPASTGAEAGQCVGTGTGSILCQLDNPIATMGFGSSFSLCSGGVCSKLYTTGSSSPRYTTASSGTMTPFTRSIKFYRLPNSSQEIEVVVTVAWQEHGQSYAAVVSDYLSPWE